MHLALLGQYKAVTDAYNPLGTVLLDYWIATQYAGFNYSTLRIWYAASPHFTACSVRETDTAV